MPVTNTEIALLNFYRASELHGGLILGQMVRRTGDPQLMLSLTRHSAEQLRHAQSWTGTIIAIGGKPAATPDTYQTRCAATLGVPLTMLEALILTQIFERRLCRHFTQYLQVAGTHPLVDATLRRMIKEKRGHLSWVKAWIDAQAKNNGTEVGDVLRRYSWADQRINAALSSEYGLKWAA